MFLLFFVGGGGGVILEQETAIFSWIESPGSSGMKHMDSTTGILCSRCLERKDGCGHKSSMQAGLERDDFARL